jgi:hypothetical protein
MGRFFQGLVFKPGLDTKMKGKRAREQEAGKCGKATADHSDMRNRIVMIRRELPRTRVAGWAVSPYRIKLTRILLPRAARPAACTVARVPIMELSLEQPFHRAISSSRKGLCVAGGSCLARAQRAAGKPRRVAATQHKQRGGNARRRLPTPLQAARCTSLWRASTRTAIAQRKRSSSRPIAATICGLFWPRALSFL